MLFFVDYETTYTTTIDAPVSSVVALLHDPPQLMRLNPVIVDVKQDPDDTAKFTITDELAVLGMKRRLVYTARVRLTESGMEAETAAGMETRTVASFCARALGEGRTQLVERSSVKCLFFLLPYINGVVAKTHTDSHTRMKELLEGQTPKAIKREFVACTRLSNLNLPHTHSVRSLLEAADGVAASRSNSPTAPSRPAGSKAHCILHP